LFPSSLCGSVANGPNILPHSLKGTTTIGVGAGKICIRILVGFSQKGQKTGLFFQKFIFLHFFSPVRGKIPKFWFCYWNVQRNKLFLKPNALIKFKKLLRGWTFFPNGSIFVPDWPESTETLLCGFTTEKV
jgi:hypothetical protein